MRHRVANDAERNSFRKKYLPPSMTPTPEPLNSKNKGDSEMRHRFVIFPTMLRLDCHVNQLFVLGQ